MSSADFIQNQLFRKILSGIPSECQTDWIQIRPDIMSGLIWVQSVCKSYQQTTLGDKALKAHADLSSKARGLNFGPRIHLHPYDVYTSSEGSGKSAHLHRLT